MKIRIVFMGSPDFALPTLRGLVEKFDIVGVVTQPDRPSGRGRKFMSPPVNLFALEKKIEVIQPEKVRNPEIIAKLQEWNPDVIVVAAYGQILKQNILDLPKYGCINVHGSLLPRWRGAAPIQAAIASGDTISGVTIMKMDAGIDTGAILSQEEITIEDEDTSDTLGRRLAEKGATLLIKTLDDYFEGKVKAVSQNEKGATYASMVKKEDGLLDFNQPAEVLERKVRAYKPWPGTYFYLDGEMIKIHQTHVIPDSTANPGWRSSVSNLPAVGTSDGWLVIDTVQPAGKSSMPGDVYLRGSRQWSMK